MGETKTEAPSVDDQYPKAARQWLDEEYPAITEPAKAEGAEIHWSDETGLRSDHQSGRSYALTGHYRTHTTG